MRKALIAVKPITVHHHACVEQVLRRKGIQCHFGCSHTECVGSGLHCALLWLPPSLSKVERTAQRLCGGGNM